MHASARRHRSAIPALPLNGLFRAASPNPPAPQAEVWAWLISAFDELISKQKRITLEDLYRGTELLAPAELVQLRNTLYTANKKVGQDAGTQRGPCGSWYWYVPCNTP